MNEMLDRVLADVGRVSFPASPRSLFLNVLRDNGNRALMLADKAVEAGLNGTGILSTMGWSHCEDAGLLRRLALTIEVWYFAEKVVFWRFFNHCRCDG